MNTRLRSTYGIYLLTASTILAGCTKKDDPTASNNNSTGSTGTSTGTTTTPGKTYTVSFNYVTNGLDTSKPATNLGAGVRLYVDGKPLNLSGSLASGDTTYYVQPQSASATFPKTLTVTGSTLRVELGFYNVVGTSTQPKTSSGQNLSIPSGRFLFVPIVNGKQPDMNTPTVTLGSYSNTPTFTYDNKKNPTRIIEFDLSTL